ncbi:hypothetical protein [Butyrivibrio sp. AE2032]|uniref:hypothetical protein n=1 Tax=Butyrivibrio sp. AE2032 TaxID=1458463 RepID=UPI00068FCFE5|nr:hypothetical protein [Butyrivibrio sp. AE2032]
MNDNKLAPIAVFGYNRLDKLQMCIESLAKNTLSKDSELYLFIDGYKENRDSAKVKEVHEWAERLGRHDDSEGLSSRFRMVHVSIKDNNVGLANSIISGVTDLMNGYSEVIVVEDDLITSQTFLEYMNAGLKFYRDDPSVWSVAAYGYKLKSLKKYDHDVYASYRSSSWGWASWKDRWEKVDWSVSDYEVLCNSKSLQKQLCLGGGDLYPMLQRQMRGESDSWAVRWAYAAAMYGMVTIYPKVGLVCNSGFDGSGTHSGIRKTKDYTFSGNSKVNFEHVKIDERIAKEFYLLHTDTIWKKVKRNTSPIKMVKLLKKWLFHIVE